MKSPNLIQSGTVAINMTPMIDVVFLLIIFFLVSSHLAKQENSVELNLPLAQTSLDDSNESNLVVVNIMPDGQHQIAGVSLSNQQLVSALRERSLRSPDGIRLKIRTDQDVSYEFIEPVLRSAADAGIADVVFSVYEDHGGR